MTNIVNSLLDRLAALLGPLSPFTKAVVPAALSVAVAVVDGLITGSVNTSSVAIAATGLILAVVAYFVPNRPAPAPPAK